MRRRALLQGGTLVLVLGTREIAWGASILSVRLWPARDYSRVTIESDRELKTTHLFVADPPRLALDIQGIELNPALRELVGKLKADDPFIEGLRVGQFAPGVVRLVLDLRQPTLPQVFALPPIASYQHRLVLDLYPTQAIDPLAALIREKTAASPPVPAAGTSGVTGPAGVVSGTGGPAAPDPLGDLIASRVRPGAPGSASATPTPAGTPALASGPGVTPGTDRLIVVAIDAGHGGEDPGAIGPGGTREKDVVLKIALKLRDRINASSVGGNPMRAYLTRDADFFVPLQVRVQKARRVQADLFVSIHADAFLNPDARGASVYALSQSGASSAAARYMADKENKADLVGGVNVTVAGDPQLQRALLDMSTTAQINDSLRLGGAMLGEIGRVGHLHKPRVEQAGFAVLKAPDIPSVLVETAFISNPDEERRLRDEDYQDQLADALLRGLLRYFANNPPLARNRAL